MVNYKEMYATLFRAQTAAIELQEQATIILKVAQQKTEEMYVDAPDAEEPEED